MANNARTPLELIRRLSAVGIALSAEKDNDRLMELILGSAKELTNADGARSTRALTTITLRSRS